MKNPISKIGFFACLGVMLFSFLAPFAFGAENLFDTLGDIKQNNPNIIDYSQQQKEGWGSLSPEVVNMLTLKSNPDGSSLKSLKDIISNSKYDSKKNNIDDLKNYLATIPGLYATDKDGAIKLEGGKPVLNDNGYQVLNQIVYKGESEIRSIVTSIAKVIRNIIAGLAVLWIVVSGIEMVLAQGDESKITEQKTSITYALIGLVIILIIERVINLFYGVPGVERGIGIGNQGISAEVFGIVSFIRAIIGAAAVLMIILSGYKIITAEGDEGKITTQKKGILWLIVGIVVIIVNKYIVEQLYVKPLENQIAGGQAITQSNITNLINAFGMIVKYLLGFVGIVAFAALIYGAASLVANYSNDEMADNAKKIIKNAIIGIIVVLSSYALVATVISFK